MSATPISSQNQLPLGAAALQGVRLSETEPEWNGKPFFLGEPKPASQPGTDVLLSMMLPRFVLPAPATKGWPPSGSFPCSRRTLHKKHRCPSTTLVTQAPALPFPGWLLAGGGVGTTLNGWPWPTASHQAYLVF